VDVSVVVPLPISVGDNMAAAFVPLGTSPPLVRIVRTLLDVVAEPGRIVVVAAEPLVEDVRAALASDNLASVSVPAIAGLASRADCLSAALECLRQASFSTTHVLVHDISSPLASAEVTQRVIEGLQGGGAVVMPQLAVTDSVKAVDVHGSVLSTVDRSVLRAIQFPRGFAIDTLAGLLAQRTPDEFAEFDEVAAAIGAAAPITFVDGDPDAFRADLPRDTEFFEAIIASR